MKLTEEHKAKLKAARENRADAVNKVLPINEKYQITSDGIQYILQEKKDNGGFSVVGYHVTLKSVVRSLLEHVAKNDIDGLIYLVGEMEKIEKIVSNFENLKKVDI
jgi:energy-converting hydrogenase A subunit M